MEIIEKQVEKVKEAFFLPILQVFYLNKQSILFIIL